MSTRRTRWGCLVAGSSLLLLACGCPPPLEPPPCTEAELTTNLRYAQSIVAADADQVVFERLGFPTCFCAVPNSSIFLPSPAERLWVRVRLADLAQTPLTPPLVNPLGIATDGRWAAATSRADGTIVVRNLDTGESTTVPGTTGYPYVTGLDWPYILAMDMDEGLFFIQDLQTGASRRPPGDGVMYPATLSKGKVFYADLIEDPSNEGLDYRLKLWDLASDSETVVAEGRNSATSLLLAPNRAVWMEHEPSENPEKDVVFAYDRASGTFSPLAQFDLSVTMWLVDAGEQGILVIQREQVPSGMDTFSLELIGYDGQRRVIDADTEPLIPFESNARFAGPYVIYPRNDGWVIYDTHDGSSREIQPFAGM